MLGDKCKVDDKHMCHRSIPCHFTSLDSCLRYSVVALARENEELKMARLTRNGEAARKWRNNSFYEKRKYKALVLWVESQGVKCPPILELLDMEMEVAGD